MIRRPYLMASGPLSLLLTIGCGSDLQVINPPTGDDLEPSLASQRFSEWSAPVNLGPPVNSASIETAPELSKGGLSLYFGSNRPDGLGRQDLYVSRRSSPDQPWGTPVNLGPLINTSAVETGAHLSRDGHLLFYNSSRPGGAGSVDIWVSWREDINDDLGWEQPVNLGAPVNSTIFEAGASTWGPEVYLWRGNPDPTGQLAPVDGDIYVSERTGQTFGAPVLVTELNSRVHEQKPSIRFDGREIFFSSSRPVACVFGSVCPEDIWSSVRHGKGTPWEEPLNLGPVVNGSSRDTQPALSEDGTMLFFVSDRSGGSGDLDIYVTTRTVRAEE